MLFWKGLECSHPNSQGVPGSSAPFSPWFTSLGQQASGEAARMLTHCLAGCRQAHQERPRPQARTPYPHPPLSDRAWCPPVGHPRAFVGVSGTCCPREFAGLSRTPGARNLELSQVPWVTDVCSRRYQPSDWASGAVSPPQV